MTSEQLAARKEYQRQYMNNKRRTNPEYRANIARITRKRKQEAKEPCINIYSNGDACCAWCPQSDIDVLCLDHIDESRTKEWTKLVGHRGGQYLYLKLRNLGYPPGFQVLCANCNMKKEALRKQAVRLTKYGH